MAFFNPITEKQKQILNSFTCERLTDDIRNIWRIERFACERVPGMVESLQDSGWNEDTKGSIAHYVIKNPAGQIVMFFSLKCGVLFDSQSVQNLLDKYRASKFWPILVDLVGGGEYRNEEEKARAHALAEEKWEDLCWKLTRSQRKKLLNELLVCWSFHEDEQKEKNTKIVRASRSFPAVELVNFCANDNTKQCWRDLDMPPNRKMGEVMFWWFIVPKMLEVSKLAGCEYAYLFAADDSAEGFLMNYYETACRFRRLNQLGAVKPLYDMNCWFMGTRLRTISPSMANDDDYAYFERIDGEDVDEKDYLLGLDYYLEEFFANFNLTDAGPMLYGANAV